jgi:hypothetical protein
MGLRSMYIISLFSLMGLTDAPADSRMYHLVPVYMIRQFGRGDPIGNRIFLSAMDAA